MSAARVPQLPRTEFYSLELLALGFGAFAAGVFLAPEISGAWLALWGVGYSASFLMMVSIRCVHGEEPVGRVEDKWTAFAHEVCSYWERDRG